MKTVIAGLEEGLQSIADALEGGGGGGGGGIPTPTLDDEGKVLTVIPQSQTKVAPEWSSIREVSRGGNKGQVLTAIGGGDYDWAPASGGGGGGVSVYRSQGNLLKSNFNAVSSGDYSGMYRANVYFYDADGNNLRNINEVINVSIMVRTYTDEYGFKFKAIDGALAISEYSEDNGFLYISSSDYTALDADHDKVYAAIICVPDTM